MVIIDPIIDGSNPFTEDPTKPVDVDGWFMARFGEFQNTAISQAAVQYSTMMVDKWFDISEQPAREDWVAICGYGPTLPMHLEYLQDFQTIVTTSGAHAMVMNAGFVPTYHVEVDWKPHKHLFTKMTHPDCTYIMSAACSPETIDNVRHRNTELMFIPHGTQVEYPQGAPLIEHGYDVGQQAIECMRLKGFRKFALFGFDYCFTLDERRHAGEHGGNPHDVFLVRSMKKVFKTSKLMFTSLLVLDRYARMHQDLEFSIYSDSLCSNFMMREITPD